jgi:SAM-dependent methyltransferase
MEGSITKDMAVVYMRELELDPATYDIGFSRLTKGISEKAYAWLQAQLSSEGDVLDYGCGPGGLARQMAVRGLRVTGYDQNQEMVDQAERTTDGLWGEAGPGVEAAARPTFRRNANLLRDIEPESLDVVTSTFALSELRPLEQQMFLRNAWRALRPGGQLLLVAEFEPTGVSRLWFRVQRWWYRRKMDIKRTGDTSPLRWFMRYLTPIGFSVEATQSWRGGSIRALALKKDGAGSDPPFYRPAPHSFNGAKPRLQMLRCLLTGQIDHVPIEPGIYASGQPTAQSPVVVTANYVLTYIRVMKALQGIDAWVLCVDSRGINVWCAARGNEFGNAQLLEAVEATGITTLTKSREIFLPQLAAGGVSGPELPQNETFPFEVTYGPVWVEDFPAFLRERPFPKPDGMRLARFTLFHRARAGLTHTTFLVRRVFWGPLLLFALGLWGLQVTSLMWVPGALLASLVLINLLLVLAFPLAEYTRVFLKKSALFGSLNLVISSGLLLAFAPAVWWAVALAPINFWIGYFSTMSFSGYSMATSPREIAAEYPTFTRIQHRILVLGLVGLAAGLVLLGGVLP